jgi:hypothetical protein
VHGSSAHLLIVGRVWFKLAAQGPEPSQSTGHFHQPRCSNRYGRKVMLKKSIKRMAAALCLAPLAVVPIASIAAESSALGPIEAMSIAVDAYVFGYPLVTFDTVRKQQTNVAKPDAEHAPMGQMIKMRSYPAVDNPLLRGTQR